MSQNSFSHPSTPSGRITYSIDMSTNMYITMYAKNDDDLILLPDVCCTVFGFRNVIHLESPSNKDINKEITQTPVS